MVDLLVGTAALHGHPPSEARNYSLRDLELIHIMHNLTRERQVD